MEARRWEAQLSKKLEVAYNNTMYNPITASQRCVDEVMEVEVASRSATYIMFNMQDERRSNSHGSRYVQSNVMWSRLSSFIISLLH